MGYSTIVVVGSLLHCLPPNDPRLLELLFMTVFAQSFLAFVRRHFVTLPFSSTRQRQLLSLAPVARSRVKNEMIDLLLCLEIIKINNGKYEFKKANHLLQAS